MINENNPFEIGETFNATRALQLCRDEPKKAKAQFQSAARRGRLDPHLSKA